MAKAPTPAPQQKTTFDQILLDASRSGVIYQRSMTNARNWFRNKAQTLVNVTARKILDEEDRKRFYSGFPTIGRMYLYQYDPKWKNTPKLPYYDHFPLIFPIEYYPDGWLGINLHYLPLNLRATLMDNLYKASKKSGYTGPQQGEGDEMLFDMNTYLPLSYEIMKATKGMKYFHPCIKRYLSAHVRSRLMLVYPSEWDAALFLPLAQWEGATQEQVWQDSRDNINNRRGWASRMFGFGRV